mmetsp:Transcript_14736/g.26213  ORF Transcript_14736/g.26213 Transcript_14736/m.26213 type:complete len:341 (-) Transcript_14736:46-1068(-)
MKVGVRLEAHGQLASDDMTSLASTTGMAAKRTLDSRPVPTKRLRRGCPDAPLRDSVIYLHNSPETAENAITATRTIAYMITALLNDQSKHEIAHGAKVNAENIAKSNTSMEFCSFVRTNYDIGSTTKIETLAGTFSSFAFLDMMMPIPVSTNAEELVTNFRTTFYSKFSKNYRQQIGFSTPEKLVEFFKNPDISLDLTMPCVLKGFSVFRSGLATPERCIRYNSVQSDEPRPIYVLDPLDKQVETFECSFVHESLYSDPHHGLIMAVVTRNDKEQTVGTSIKGASRYLYLRLPRKDEHKFLQTRFNLHTFPGAIFKDPSRGGFLTQHAFDRIVGHLFISK